MANTSAMANRPTDASAEMALRCTGDGVGLRVRRRRG